jgi:two-component system, OmpR family, KDP operon response regulator KdpE
MPVNSVLLVEDDEAVRRFFEEALREAGFSVRSVPLASETFAALHVEVPDIIVLDLGMPRGTLQGMEMLTRLREIEAWRSIPVVILSAFGDVVNRDVTRRLGVIAILAKPLLDVEELVRILRTAPH